MAGTDRRTDAPSVAHAPAGRARGKIRKHLKIITSKHPTHRSPFPVMPPTKKKLGPSPLLTEVVDYETSGPDIDAHKSCSNKVFMFCCCSLVILLGVIVLLDLKKTSKAKSGGIGTAKG